MYKKLVVFILALGSAMSLKAQTQKGNQLIGGTISLSVSKQNDQDFYPSSTVYSETDTKSTSFSIGPAYSYFIANKLDLGASVNYNHQNARAVTEYPNYGTNPPSKSVTNGVMASVYLRKYFLYNEKIGFRLGPILQYVYSKQEDKYAEQPPNYKLETNRILGGVFADFVYFPTKKLGLSSSIGGLNYAHETSDQIDSKQTYSSFGFVLFNSLQLSLSYVIGK